MATSAVISSTLVLLLLLVAFSVGADAIGFFVKNQCPYTVWAAAMSTRERHGAGGGAELTLGKTWQFHVADGATDGKVWARTLCTFDPFTGRGSCYTGDCGGALQCDVAGKPPMTMAEFIIGNDGKPDMYGISVVYGYNVPMDFSCSGADVIRCRDRNCPDAIRGYGYDKYHQCQGNIRYYEVVFCPY